MINSLIQKLKAKTNSHIKVNAINSKTLIENKFINGYNFSLKVDKKFYNNFFKY